MKFKLPRKADVDGAIWRYDSQSPRYARHHHDELELNLVLSGRAAYLVGDQRVEITPRTLLWLLPRQEHLLIDISDDFDMWVIAFRKRLVTRVCVSDASRVLRAGRSRTVLQRRVVLARAHKLSQVCEAVHAEQDTDSFNAGLGYVLAQAAGHFAASDVLAAQQQVHVAVERAAYLVSREPSLTATELSTRCGLSPARLGRLFQAQLGQSLVTFRNRQRVAHVLDHFDPDRHTMLQIALDAGFGSYAQFHRVFRQVTGRSPADYKRKLTRSLL
jgi:AraC-like DNA-binding protein